MSGYDNTLIIGENCIIVTLLKGMEKSSHNQKIWENKYPFKG